MPVDTSLNEMVHVLAIKPQEDFFTLFIAVNDNNIVIALALQRVNRLYIDAFLLLFLLLEFIPDKGGTKWV